MQLRAIPTKAKKTKVSVSYKTDAADQATQNQKMAYASLSSFMHTLEQFLEPNPRFLCESKQEVESTYHNLCALQVFLEDANPSNLDIETLKLLEKKIRDVVYKAEDALESRLRSIILADCRDNRDRARNAFDDEMRKVEKEVDSLKKEVMQIKFKKHESNYTNVRTSSSSSSLRMNATTMQSQSQTSWSRLTESNAIEQNTIVGMEGDLNTIRNLLTAQTYELTVVSVVGMGGIGKTTLARKLYDDPSIRNRFDICAWVTISEEYNERQMLHEVFFSISGDRTEASNDQLLEIVYRRLKRRRYLIVIDDLWSTEAWDQIKRIFPDDNNESRLLLTTRLKYVADYASDALPPHNMSFLNLDDCWSLFIEKIFKRGCCPPELEKIGKRIVQQCKGLPLSIVVIAGLLAKMDPTLDNWKRVEESLKSFLGTVFGKCLAILSMSYNYLPQYLKACFLYMGGFPEDKEINVLKLIRLWISERFIKECNHKRLEVVAEECLEELIDRSLILVGRREYNGRIRTCKIHDLLRQLCLREAKIENVMHPINDRDLIFSECIYDQRRVMPHPKDYGVFVSHLNLEGGIRSKTRSLILLGLPITDTFPIVSHLKLLKVLDVISMERDFSSTIPQLVHLSYVAAKIDENLPPSLSNLWNLHTLILRTLSAWSVNDVSLRRMHRPKTLHLPLEIWTMSQIRHLDIGSSIQMPNPLQVGIQNIGQQHLFLNNLQTLATYFFQRSPEYSGIVTEILRRTLNLNKLSITGLCTDSEWSALHDCLIHLHGLEILRITGSTSYIQVHTKDAFPPNLQQLELSSIHLRWENMIVLAKLPNLEVLKLKYAMLEPWIFNEEVVFQRLKFLQLFQTNLQRWEATSDNFPMLEQLVLMDCLELEEIPQGIGEITTLRKITLKWCLPAVETSARKLQEEQESWGNYGLQVLIL